MTVMDQASAILAGVRNELLLFAGVGLLLGGLDDFLLDCLYAVRRLWRDATVYRRHRRMTADTLPPSRRPGTLAIFIPAWDEGAVIGQMLRHCLARWAGEDVHLFVGVYPNDAATIAAVTQAGAAGGRVTMAVNPLPGPTTKADCLNGLWRALLRWEQERGTAVKAVVLHDAEQVVTVLHSRISRISAVFRLENRLRLPARNPKRVRYSWLKPKIAYFKQI